MARSHQPADPLTPALSARRGAMACRQRRMLGLALLACPLWLGACRGAKEPVSQDFVGKWKSSKLETPIYLHANGEWEIKTADGLVLQYGVWEYRKGFIVWTVKIGERLGNDANQVLACTAEEFKLREGAETTVFRRLE